MGRYDVQQVCLNGHQITDAYHELPENRQDFCKECGEKTIISCPKCDAPIRGHYFGALINFNPPLSQVPDYCHNCGAIYPWKERSSRTPDELSSSDSSSSIALIEKLCRGFHQMARQLRARSRQRAPLEISDEYDVQYLLHALLKVFFADVRPEESTPSYAGKSSRVDFLLKDEQIALEAKMTREGLGGSEVGTQLIEDIARYREHPRCKTLICFVYDPEERIANAPGLENDLSRDHDGLAVVVWVVPKGY